MKVFDLGILVKMAQQGLLFYPFNKRVEEATERAPPVGQAQNGEAIYRCFGCGQNILEEEVHAWLKVPAQGGDIRGTNYGPNPSVQYQSPYGNVTPEMVAQAINRLAQLVTPYVQSYRQQSQQWHQENNKDPNSPYSNFDYGYEVNMPDVWEYITTDPLMAQVREIAKVFSSSSYFDQLPFDLRGPEVSGQDMRNLGYFVDNPQQTINIVVKKMQSNPTFGIAVLQPFCSECGEDMPSCEICEEIIGPDEHAVEMVDEPHALVCRQCIERGRAEQCCDCGKADYSDSNDIVITDEGTFCKDCRKKMGEEAREWASDAIASLNLPIGKTLPLSQKALQTLLTFFQYLKNTIPPDRTLDETLWSKIKYLAQKQRLPSEAIQHLLWLEKKHKTSSFGYVEQQLTDIQEAQNYLKEQYPQFKDLRDMPVDIKVVESYSVHGNDKIPSFTLVITPTPEFIEWAEHVQPGAAQAWRLINKSPHHKNSLAYARVAWDRGNLVVNNLQRDADSDALATRYTEGDFARAAKWWDKQTRNFDLFLLHVVKAMAKAHRANAYVTSFDSQRRKWHNLPIHKAKKTYEETPSMMGAEKDQSPYELSEDGYNDAWKLARKKLYRHKNG